IGTWAAPCRHVCRDRCSSGDAKRRRSAVAIRGRAGTWGAERPTMKTALLCAIGALGVVAAASPDGRAPIVARDLSATGLLDTPGGRETFRYAVECGLPRGVSVTHSGEEFFGAGYLTTTASWSQRGLDRSEREDLFTCIAARLNPVGNHVMLAVGGPHVSK